MEQKNSEIQRAVAVFLIGGSLTVGIGFGFARNWGLAALAVCVGLMVGVRTWPRR